jgi:hypothetical protein
MEGLKGSWKSPGVSKSAGLRLRRKEPNNGFGRRPSPGRELVFLTLFVRLVRLIG